ncbi:hypothetical protein ACSBR2_008843 [Camellia fascicularis]
MIGDGGETFLWLDNWHPIGPLYKIYGERVVRDLGSSLLAKVSSIIRNGYWRWSRLKNRSIHHIIENTHAAFLPSPEYGDSVLWCPAANGEFSVRSA